MGKQYNEARLKLIANKKPSDIRKILSYKNISVRLVYVVACGMCDWEGILTKWLNCENFPDTNDKII